VKYTTLTDNGFNVIPLEFEVLQSNGQWFRCDTVDL